MIPRLPILVVAALGCGGCLRESAEAPGEPPTVGEVASWIFEDDPSATLFSLWPAEPGAPARRKKDLLTSRRDGALLTQVKGPDPYLLWRLPTPRPVAALSVTLEASASGTAQAFWATADCPTFRESCSAQVPVGEGHVEVDFLLDATTPLRGLRFDLPAIEGARFRIESIRLKSEPRLQTAWAGRAGHSDVERRDDGLLVDARGVDPWLVAYTPGLEASRVRSIDVTIEGPRGATSEIFWAGDACEHFSPQCAVLFESTDGGTSTQGVALHEHPKWTGSIRALRLDPGQDAAEYRIERVTLRR